MLSAVATEQRCTNWGLCGAASSGEPSCPRLCWPPERIAWVCGLGTAAHLIEGARASPQTMSGAATGYTRMQGAICKTMMWSTLSALSKKKPEKNSCVELDGGAAYRSDAHDGMVREQCLNG
jgi:hypothetical protein